MKRYFLYYKNMLKSLKTLRQEAGLTQQDLQHLTGLHQVVISNIESGKFSPQSKTKQRIEKILGRVDWLDNACISIEESNFLKAQSLFKRLLEQLYSMPDEERKSFMLMMKKYLNE